MKAALIREHGISVNTLNVNTYRGVAQLSGFVESGAMVGRAAETAGNVPGVQSVKNDIRFAPPPK